MPVTGTAADAETALVEDFAHNWLTPDGARGLRQFLAERYHDERAGVQGRLARGERGPAVYAECRRLAAWCAAVDADLAWRG